MSTASAVNSKDAFWFATYEGGLSGELFVTPLKELMLNRKKAVHLIVHRRCATTFAKGRKLGPWIHEQLAQIGRDPKLTRPFFRHPSVSYISGL